MLLTIPFGFVLMGSLMGIVSESPHWICPEFNGTKLYCLCDFPRTLRCTTNLILLEDVIMTLKTIPIRESVSLLDITFQNVTYLPGSIFEGVPLHGLILASGELKNLSKDAFKGLGNQLQALGLPNNELDAVPTDALDNLQELDRLDLSYNKLHNLKKESFKGLKNLKFLDLTGNQIVNIVPDAFSSLKKLTVLKLNRNKLKVPIVSALKDLDSLQELDLSLNDLLGPLKPTTIPKMPSLRTLSLNNNQFSSVCQNALNGTPGLLSLSLNNNQIDVLEDHAFKEVSSLRALYLSNNRIVAISESSLAHLIQLTELDLSHNFLRALTTDITVPLKTLRMLRLDDNDISIIEMDAFRSNVSLERLTLSDNPLSCDCNLIDFAIWLDNTTTLNPSDKKTAVCMTPPHLENALVMETSITELRCEESDYDLFLQDGSSATHVLESQIVLRACNFNGSSITLLWSIDSKAKSFSCDALFVYEEMATHEVLLTSIPLRCNSSQMADPTTLVVRFAMGSMQPFHRYRFCVVLLEDNKVTDDVQLVLGCSEIIPLIMTNDTFLPPPSTSNHSVKIESIAANVSGDTLSIWVNLQKANENSKGNKCHVTVTVLSMGNLLAQHLLNCTNPVLSMSGLGSSGYQVCASLDHHHLYQSSPADGLKCITVKDQMKSEATILLTICFVLVSTFVFLVLYFAYGKIIRQSRLKRAQQCFKVPNNHGENKQHSRYMKLQTTINL